VTSSSTKGSATPSKAAAGRQQIISVVDDDAAVRASLSDLLDSAGYQALSFPDGEAFMNSSLGLTSDVVITDIHMPGIDGLTLMDRLREKSGRRIPVIIITANPDERVRSTAQRKGCFAFLHKPCDPSVLIDSLHQALER
jgi:FixJ family two-component response regulator